MFGQDCGICLGFRGCLGWLLDPCSHRPFVSLPIPSHSRRCSLRGYAWPCSNCVVVTTCGLFVGLQSFSRIVLDNLRASTHSQIHSGWNPRLDDGVVRVLSSCGPSAHRFQCRDVFRDGTGHVACMGLFGTRHSQFASAGRRLCLALLSVAHGVVTKQQNSVSMFCCGAIQHPSIIIIIIFWRMDTRDALGSIWIDSSFFRALCKTIPVPTIYSNHRIILGNQSPWHSIWRRRTVAILIFVQKCAPNCLPLEKYRYVSIRKNNTDFPFAVVDGHETAGIVYLE